MLVTWGGTWVRSEPQAGWVYRQQTDCRRCCRPALCAAATGTMSPQLNALETWLARSCQPVGCPRVQVMCCANQKQRHPTLIVNYISQWHKLERCFVKVACAAKISGSRKHTARELQYACHRRSGWRDCATQNAKKVAAATPGGGGVLLQDFCFH